MHALLYRSRARAGLLASDLNDIVATAQARNRQLGVTGLLLYGELEVVPGAPGEFVQWIEGSQGAVDDLYGVVAGDPRHTEVEVLGRGALARLTAGVLPTTARPGGRLFADWDMGLVRLSELPATLDGFLRFATSWDAESQAHAPDAATSPTRDA